MKASSPPRPSPSRVPPSPSPASSQLVDAHHEPLNRLAQVSKMIQQAKAGAMLDAAFPSAAAPDSSGADDQNEHPAQSRDAQASGAGSAAPLHATSAADEDFASGKLLASSHEAGLAAPSTTATAVLTTSPTSLPQVHWGFGSRSAALVQGQEPRKLSKPDKVSQLATEEQQALSSPIEAHPPHVSGPAPGELLLQSLSAAAPESEVDARLDARSSAASSCVSALLEKEPETTSLDMIKLRSAAKGRATNASTGGTAPASDDQLPSGCTPEGRHDWGSFGLSVLESQDSVPVWDTLPRQPIVPFTPSAHADASSVAQSDSQTQSQSSDSQGASDFVAGISRPEAAPTTNEIAIPLTQRATYFLRADPLNALHDSSSPVSEPHSVQRHPNTTSTPLSQLFTPAQKSDDDHGERLQRSPTFTASAETTGRPNLASWNAAGATASSPDMSQVSSSDVSRDQRSAASSSPAPRLEGGWSVAVNPGGSWEEQSKSDPSPKPSPVKDLNRAMPAAAPMVNVDESLPFLLHSPAPSLPGELGDASLSQKRTGVALPSDSSRAPAGRLYSDAEGIFEDAPTEAKQVPAKELFNTADESFSARLGRQDLSVDEDVLEVERSTQTAASTSQSPDRDRPDTARSPVPAKSSAAVWQAAEARAPILDDSHRRSGSIASISRRRRPAVRQLIEIMIPPPPRRRGKSTLVCDGRVPGSVQRANAWQQKQWFALLQASASEEERRSPVASTSSLALKTDRAAGQRKVTPASRTAATYVPSRSTLSVNKQGLGKDRQSRLVFSKARVEEDESWRPTSALPASMARPKSSRPKLDKPKHNNGKQAVPSSSDEAPDNPRRSGRQSYHALPNRSSREHARALTRSIIQDQESDSEEEMPRSTTQRSQAARRRLQQVMIDEEDESQRSSAAAEAEQLDQAASTGRSATALPADAEDQRSSEATNEQQRELVADSGDESSAPVLVGIRQAEREIPSHAEAAIEITSSGSARDGNEVIEISEDSVTLSQPAVVSPQVAVRAAVVSPAQMSNAAVVSPSSPRRQKLAAVTVPARQAPRLLSIQSGISTLEALKRMRKDAGSTELPVGNNGNESSTTESVESIVKAATTAPRPEASSADLDDLRRLREEQEEIRQEQAWLAEQRKAADTASTRYEEEEQASDSWDTSADRTAETEADSWAEPRPQRGERSADRAGRGEKELRPLGKFVGELLQHAQTTGKQKEPRSTSVRSPPQQAGGPSAVAKQTSRGGMGVPTPAPAPAPALLQGPTKRPATSITTAVLATPIERPPPSTAGRETAEGQKRKAPSPAEQGSDLHSSSPVSKRPRVDREEGRKRLARLLKAIGD